MVERRLWGLETTRVGSTLVVRVRGEIDRFTAPELGRALEEAREPGQDIILVLNGVTYLDMGGIKILEAEAGTARDRGRALVVAEPAPGVRRIMEIIGFDRVVPVLPTLDDALRHLRADTSPPSHHPSAGPGTPDGGK